MQIRCYFVLLFVIFSFFLYLCVTFNLKSYKYGKKHNRGIIPSNEGNANAI